ncbi:MAG: hypothetical protein KAX16_04395, partial [Actinomycetia bacterium]|nr:hypothetical protein [Actinomycetes bacterium]
MFESRQKQKKFKWVNLRFRRALAGMLIVFLMFPVNLPLALAQQPTTEQNQSSSVSEDMGLADPETAPDEGEGEIEEPAPTENPDELTEPAPEHNNPEDEPPSNITPVPDESNDDVVPQIPDITAPAEEPPEEDAREDVP